LLPHLNIPFATCCDRVAKGILRCGSKRDMNKDLNRGRRGRSPPMLFE